MIAELVVSLVLLILLITFLNPFQWWMPSDVHMMLLAAVVVLFALFALFVFREKVSDERESLHRFIAARFAYLLGTTILVIGIIIQTIQHTLDNWLVITLGVMVLAKIVGILYSKARY